MSKLNPGQLHVIKLIARDRGEDGWTPVSAKLYNSMVAFIPEALVEFRRVGETGSGAARLTNAGQGIVEAAEWLR